MLLAGGTQVATAADGALGMLMSSTTDEQPLSLVSYQSIDAASDQACRPAASTVCCTPPWAHTSGVFGEAMLIRARNSDVAYGLPVNGTVPNGSVGVLDSEFDFGFRFGLVKALDNCHSVVATYTGFISEDTDTMAGVGPISKLLVHPDSANAATNAVTASGETDLDFHLFDLDYRFLLHGSDCSAINMTIGARYGHLDHDIEANYYPAGLVEKVSSDIDFDGAGLRLGLDFEHHVGRGLFAYGKANASFLAGEFEASYLHSSDVTPVVATTDWEAARLVSMLDLELGAGWRVSNNLRFSGGYVLSSWFNTISNDQWINAVRENSNAFTDMSDTLTFDGFNLRAELRF